MKTSKGITKKSSSSNSTPPKSHDESNKIKESNITENLPLDFAVAEKDEVKNAEEKMRQQRKGKKGE